MNAYTSKGNQKQTCIKAFQQSEVMTLELPLLVKTRLNNTLTDLLYEAEQSKVGQVFSLSSMYITVLTQCLEK